jgi:hypothetical protein
MDIHYFITFLISGFIVSGISYIGNLFSPITASILAGIPISVPSTLLIKGRFKQKQFINSAFHMVCILALCTGFCSYLMHNLDVITFTDVSISLILLLILSTVYYMYSV